jgi:chemotaxis protein CheC
VASIDPAPGPDPAGAGVDHGPGADADGGTAAAPSVDAERDEGVCTVRLSVDALSTFYEMAREGAGLAADRLTRLTGVDTRVSVSRLDFTAPERLYDAAVVGGDLGDHRFDAAVHVGLSGGIEGESYVLFEETQARAIAHDLVVDVAEPTEDLLEAAVVETGQIMTSGFVDGWADVLRAQVDVSTPTYATGGAVRDLLRPTDAQAAGELALLFRNRIETASGETDMVFEHCLVPTAATADEWFAAAADEPSFEYEKLVGFERMAQQGADEVATNLTTMTDLGVAVDVRRINFVSLDAIPEEVSTDPLVAVAFGFEGTPSGYLLFLFDESSAHRLVETTLGSLPSGRRLDAAERDAVQEVCNIMSSRLLDGWANLLGGTIDHTTPAYAHDFGPAVVDPLIVGLSEGQEFAFVFDTRVVADDDASEFDVDVYVIPDQAELETALDRLDTERIRETPTTAQVAVSELSDDVDVRDRHDDLAGVSGDDHELDGDGQRSRSGGDRG